MKSDIRNHSSMTGIEKVAEKLYNFAQEQLGFDKPARVVFESHGDRAVDMFSPTGNYNPQTKTITIFVDHRHPKDILRSMAHELVHHSQCCQGAFDDQIDTSPGYAQKDDRMRELEKDAYFWGNGILFRDWEDNHKQKRSWDLMNENKRQNINEQKLRRKIRRLILETLREQERDPTRGPMSAEISGDLARQRAGTLRRGAVGSETGREFQPGSEGEREQYETGLDPFNPVTPTEIPPEAEEIEEGSYGYKRDEDLEEQEIPPTTAAEPTVSTAPATMPTTDGPPPPSSKRDDDKKKGLEENNGDDDEYDWPGGIPDYPPGPPFRVTATPAGIQAAEDELVRSAVLGAEESAAQMSLPTTAAEREAQMSLSTGLPAGEEEARMSFAPESDERTHVSVPRRIEEEKPLKEWYNDQLHEALLKKFKIKK